MKSTIKWTSVRDSVPKAEERVLFWAEYERGGSAGYGYKAEDDEDSALWRDESCVDRDGDPDYVYTVTHWCYVSPPNNAINTDHKDAG